MKTQSISELIKHRRVVRKMRQRDVAELFDVSQQLVGNWERGEAPAERHLKTLSEFLGIPEEEVEAMRSEIVNSQVGNVVRDGTMINQGYQLSEEEAYLIRLIRKQNDESLIDRIIGTILNK